MNAASSLITLTGRISTARLVAISPYLCGARRGVLPRPLGESLIYVPDIGSPHFGITLNSSMVPTHDTIDSVRKLDTQKPDFGCLVSYEPSGNLSYAWSAPYDPPTHSPEVPPDLTTVIQRANQGSMVIAIPSGPGWFDLQLFAIHNSFGKPCLQQNLLTEVGEVKWEAGVLPLARSVHLDALHGLGLCRQRAVMWPKVFTWRAVDEARQKTRDGCLRLLMDRGEAAFIHNIPCHHGDCKGEHNNTLVPYDMGWRGTHRDTSPADWGALMACYQFQGNPHGGDVELYLDAGFDIPNLVERGFLDRKAVLAIFGESFGPLGVPYTQDKK